MLVCLGSTSTVCDKTPPTKNIILGGFHIKQYPGTTLSLRRRLNEVQSQEVTVLCQPKIALLPLGIMTQLRLPERSGMSPRL